MMLPVASSGKMGDVHDVLCILMEDIVQLAAVEAEVIKLKAGSAKIVSCDVAQHADATASFFKL